MYTDEDIDSAVKAGIFTQETAKAFRYHVAQINQTSAVDEEYFRLVTGFNDIFVVIACALLLVSVAWIGTTFTPWMGALATTIVAWLLAEFFTRKRRMALPSIVLLLIFVGSFFATSFFSLDKSANSILLGSAIAAVAAWLHWRRFHVPITIAAGTAAGIGFLATLLFSLIPEARNYTAIIFLLAGVSVFCLAMYWDAADLSRQTRKSDIAFWLHLLAAPLLVHPVFTQLNVFSGQINGLQATVVILLYLAIALVSLAIDRRALMVSALIYVLYTFSTLLKQFGIVSLGFAITAFSVGSALLLLSALWHSGRKIVLNCLLPALRERLPPLR